jgi:hypothetical protein
MAKEEVIICENRPYVVKNVPRKICIVASDGGLWSIPEHRLDEAYTIDPDLRLIPPSNPNELILTGEDCAFLWSLRIVAG